MRLTAEALRLDVLEGPGRGDEAAGLAARLRPELDALLAQASPETRAELEAWPALARIRGTAP